MMEKHLIRGPEEERIILQYHKESETLMAGCLNKFRPFLEHLCFRVLKLKVSSIQKEEKNRQNHKHRYYFTIDPLHFQTQMYSVKEKYSVNKISSIIKDS